MTIASVGTGTSIKVPAEKMIQILNVACTRARDRLMVWGVEPASEYLQDMVKASTTAS